jgi:hypothetical protein
MRRTFVLSLVGVLLAVGLLFVGAPRIGAITNGFVDTNADFPNVGAFIVRSATGTIFPLCTGTLIAHDVFLTASHCTEYFEDTLRPLGWTAWVSFDTPIAFGNQTGSGQAVTLVEVTQIETNPGYTHVQSDPGDIAVLLVNAADTAGISPAVLPEAGLLDRLSRRNGLKNTHYTVVGYGSQDRVVGGGPPFFTDANPVPRMFAYASFNALNGAWLRLSQNPATGNGGACFGDSGGPNFLSVDGVQTLVAITITGDAVCRATNVVYRVDTEAARTFLEQFLQLP